MLLPHIGDLPLATYGCRKAMICASACASSIVDAFTRSISPLRPCVPLFHASIASSAASLWCTASVGPSTRTFSCESVTITAISMMRSVSGNNPVISRSIQIRFWSFRASVSVMA